MQAHGAKPARRTRTATADSSDSDGPPLLDDEASTFISQAFHRADAFLFGRRTYEIFAGSWGQAWIGKTPSERR